MKYIIVILFFCSVASAQIDVPDDAKTITKTVWLDTLTVDSALVCELPAFVALTEMYIVIDTALVSSGGTDSIKVGIQGEKTVTPHRFADLAIDSLAVAMPKKISHTHFRQTAAGALYTYDGTVAITCTNAETYYPVQSLTEFPYNDLKTTSGGAMCVPAYRDGWYQVGVQASFESSKANVRMHGELYRNGAPYDYASFERTISTAAQIGSASFMGGIYLAEGDTLKLYVKTDVNATVYTIQHCQFILIRQMDQNPYVTDKPRKIYLYCDAATGQIRVIVKYRSIL